MQNPSLLSAFGGPIVTFQCIFCTLGALGGIISQIYPFSDLLSAANPAAQDEKPQGQSMMPNSAYSETELPDDLRNALVRVAAVGPPTS